MALEIHMEAGEGMARTLKTNGIPSYTKMERDEKGSFIESLLIAVFLYYADDENKDKKED